MSVKPAPNKEFVFLHGGGQGSWVWDNAIDSLQRLAKDITIKTVALDVPGCGVKRRRDTAGLGMDDVVVELVEDVDRAGLKNGIIVGHSQAGTVLPKLIVARPDMFRRAVYVACCAPAAGQTVREMMGSGRHGEDPETVGWPIPLATASPAEFASQMFCNDMDEDQRSAFFAKLGQDKWPDACAFAYRDWQYNSAHTPAAYVVLSGDNALPPAWQHKFADRLKVDRVLSIESGHQVMQTQPERLAELLLQEAGL